MELAELERAWRAGGTQNYGTERIEAFLRHATENRRNKFNLLLKYDYLISLIICILFILISFYLDLKYKWMAATFMAAFTATLYLHYRFLERLASIEPGAGGLVRIIEDRLALIKKFRRLYSLAIPGFSACLALAFILIYTDLEVITITIACILVILATWITVQLMWKVLYRRHTEGFENLRRISERLRK